MSAEAMEAAEPAPWEEHDWIFRGRRLTAKGKLAAGWLDHHGTERVFSDPPKGGVVGGRYTVRCFADGATMSTRPPVFLEKADTVAEEQLAEWRLADRMAWVEQEAEKDRRRCQRENGDFGKLTLDQVRQEMLYAGGLRRGALLASVLGYIEGGR